MKTSLNAPCLCESDRKYKHCCRPFHQGRPAPTPEALMRSRYTAYALGQVAYLMQTTHPAGPHYQPDLARWQTELASFCRSTRFAGLTILSVENGEADNGWVTFTATLFQGQKDVSFTERSLFKQVEGRWLYLSGEFL